MAWPSVDFELMAIVIKGHLSIARIFNSVEVEAVDKELILPLFTESASNRADCLTKPLTNPRIIIFRRRNYYE